MRLRATEMVVDADAITANVQRLREVCAPARICAVVKADGYGHGGTTSARAALAGGARWLAVALVEEGELLRGQGIDAPILVLSEPPAGASPALAANGLTATVYSERAITELAAVGVPIDVHLKIDTGMHRVGAHPDDAFSLAKLLRDHPMLRHTGTFTHLAVADAPDDPYNTVQLTTFDAVLAGLRSNGMDPGICHAANSAGAIADSRTRYDMVRCGIAIYGQSPEASFDAETHGVVLRPAIRLVSEVRHVKTVAGRARVSYGLTYELAQHSVLATVPIGYADGVPRRLSAVGGEVLINGRRHRIAGRITMDQLVVDCGGCEVLVGDEVVLLGRQGPEEITAWEWATRLDTIAYEITCGIGARVPRHVVYGGVDGGVDGGVPGGAG